MDKYHSSSCLTFKKQLEIEEKYKFGEHQKDARRALHQHAPHFQIALEYYADELKTKRFEICLYTHPHPLVDCPVVDSQLMIGWKSRERRLLISITADSEVLYILFPQNYQRFKNFHFELEIIRKIISCFSVYFWPMITVSANEGG